MSDELVTDVDQAVEFLQRFHPNGPWHLSAIDPESGEIRNKTFTVAMQPHMRGWVESNVDGKNLYFSVGRSEVVADFRLSEKDVAYIDWLQVDVDRDDVETVLAQVDAWDYDIPPPTVVLVSGNGVQLFWRLSKTHGREDAAKVKAANKYFCKVLNGDRAAVDVARLMRLSGTTNFPNAKKRDQGRTEQRAYLVEFHDDRSIDLPDIDTDEPPMAEVSYTLETYRSAVPCEITTMEGVPDKAKAIALHGVDADIDNPPNDKSASGWFFSMLATCTSAGVPPDVIAGICRSDELHESLKYHIHRNKGDGYVARQIEKALQKFPQVDGGKSVPFSEDHLALTFAKAHREDLRYCAHRGAWFSWDKSRWFLEDTLLAWDLVKAVNRQAASFLPDDAKTLKRTLLSKKTVAAVEHLARSDRRMAVSIDQFDADPMLLNTPDGVVDLVTGELTPSARDLLMTKLTAVAPQRGQPEKFLNFLRWAVGDDSDFVEYVQRIMGYCLTGSTKEHALFFVHGPGGNGKSVLQELLQWLLADYATSTTFDTLAMSQGVQHPTDLAGMKGARLVVAPETEANQRWAEAKIKRMTGGDRIAARFMRQDFFEYTPQFKLFVVGNHKPGFANVDQAIRRRIHLLPFTQEIAADQVDRDLCETLKREEGGKILNWAIEGAVAWADDGLKAPAAITGATDDYLENEDVLGLWLGECTDDGGFTRISELYECYVCWCRATGERPLSQRKFGTQLDVRGWPSEKGGAGSHKGRAMVLNEHGLEVVSKMTGSMEGYPNAM